MADLTQFDQQLQPVVIDSRYPVLLPFATPKPESRKTRVRYDRVGFLLAGLTLGAILGAGHWSVAVAAGVAWVGSLMLVREYLRDARGGS